MTDQIPYGAGFDASEFAENPEPRVPCVLLLDISGSMAGPPIVELNGALVTFKDTLAADTLASKRAEIAIVTFGGTVQVIQDFVTAEQFVPPALLTSGDTPMGQAINRGIEMVSQRKETYKRNGISYYRPWIFLITDGGPTDAWKDAAARVSQGEKDKSFALFAVGVDRANMDILRQIAVREPMKLRGLQFRDLFLWLSQSMQAVSHSKPRRQDLVAGRERLVGDLMSARFGAGCEYSNVEPRLWQCSRHLPRAYRQAMPGPLYRTHTRVSVRNRSGRCVR